MSNKVVGFKQKFLLFLEPHLSDFRWFRRMLGGKWEKIDTPISSPIWCRTSSYMFLYPPTEKFKIIAIEDYSFKAGDKFCKRCLLHESLFIKINGSFRCPRCIETEYVAYKNLSPNEKQKATKHINWNMDNLNRISIDDRIDLWHTGQFSCSLNEFLLMDTEEYKAFVTTGKIPTKLTNYYY